MKWEGTEKKQLEDVRCRLGAGEAGGVTVPGMASDPQQVCDEYLWSG